VGVKHKLCLNKEENMFFLGGGGYDVHKRVLKLKLFFLAL
jgi:hypothetical protein